MQTTRSLVAALLLGGVITACSGATDPPARNLISIVDGDGQEAVTIGYSLLLGKTSWVLPKALRVRVTTEQGEPVVGTEVRWIVDGGTVEPTSSPTDADGIATTQWNWSSAATGWATVGPHTAVATAPGATTVTFTGYARAGITLADVSVAPDTVDVTASGAQVTVTVHTTDDRQVPNLAYASAQFYNPTATTSVFDSFIVDLTLSDGTAADGTWTGTFTVPQDAEGGDWSLGRLTLGWGSGGTNRVELFDTALATLGFPYLLHVVGEASSDRAALPDDVRTGSTALARGSPTRRSRASAE